jgi:YbgC/YbaW family acyl-CoA thioester hydrolase
MKKTRFTTELHVRPDDIDMNRHVHNSRYLDYVLAARYDQMARCYQMPMEEFLSLGYAWVTKAVYFEYKRPLKLGDVILVDTWIEHLIKDTVRVMFDITRKDTKKLAASGYFDYTMVSLETGRGVTIPTEIMARYDK